MTFVLTFLTSTWYIKNPFLKSKINDVRFAWYYTASRLIPADCLLLGAFHEYMGLWSRAKWYSREFVEF